MKTVEELYREVLASEALKKEFLALRPEEIEGFAAKYGCEAKLDEIRAFFEAKRNEPGELSDAEMNQVAGGKGVNRSEIAMSIFTAGIACGVQAIVSAASGDAGTDIKGDAMLCDMDLE